MFREFPLISSSGKVVVTPGIGLLMGILGSTISVVAFTFLRPIMVLQENEKKRCVLSQPVADGTKGNRSRARYSRSVVRTWSSRVSGCNCRNHCHSNCCTGPTCVWNSFSNPVPSLLCCRISGCGSCKEKQEICVLLF